VHRNSHHLTEQAVLPCTRPATSAKLQGAQRACPAAPEQQLPDTTPAHWVWQAAVTLVTHTALQQLGRAGKQTAQPKGQAPCYTNHAHSLTHTRARHPQHAQDAAMQSPPHKSTAPGIPR
jgi:hypothetical protein